MKLRSFSLKLASLAVLALVAPALADDKNPPSQTPKADTDKDTNKDTNRDTNKDTNRDTDTNKDKSKQAKKLGADEIKVVSHLHHVNQMEIQLGQFAQRVA